MQDLHTPRPARIFLPTSIRRNIADATSMIQNGVREGRRDFSIVIPHGPWKTELVTDLIAYFKLLQKRVHDRLDEAVKKGWTPDEFIKSFDEII